MNRKTNQIEEVSSLLLLLVLLAGCAHDYPRLQGQVDPASKSFRLQCRVPQNSNMANSIPLTIDVCGLTGKDNYFPCAGELQTFLIHLHHDGKEVRRTELGVQAERGAEEFNGLRDCWAGSMWPQVIPANGIHSYKMDLSELFIIRDEGYYTVDVDCCTPLLGVRGPLRASASFAVARN